MLNVTAAEFAVLVAVMPLFTVKFPAPFNIKIFSVPLEKVRLPAMTLLFTVVLPAAEKVALSPSVHDTALDPFHQVLLPVQFPSPPDVTLPVELQVTSAALADSAGNNTLKQMVAKTAELRLRFKKLNLRLVCDMCILWLFVSGGELNGVGQPVLRFSPEFTWFSTRR